ncbi:MAG: phosphotransferase [Octadecabacter sp.]
MAQSNIFSDPRADAIMEMVDEFADHLGFSGKADVARIFTSPVAPQDRQVLRVIFGDDIYAMKIDFTSPDTDRLAREFSDLQRMTAHFAKYEKLGTVTPIYLSKAGTFFTMNFLGFPTAGQRLKESQSLQTTRQVYRRVGLWLSAMHDYKDQVRGKFNGAWMTREVDALVEADNMRAPVRDVLRMRDLLHKQNKAVFDVRGIRAWGHGDYHSENIMLAPGKTYAFDLTEARMKMAVYDVVDFLKVDVFRQMPGEAIDRSGIIAKHREMFFRGYKHDIKPELFDVAMRGRLLIDWAGITPSGYQKSEHQKLQYTRLKDRLDVAFSG